MSSFNAIFHVTILLFIQLLRSTSIATSIITAIAHNAHITQNITSLQTMRKNSLLGYCRHKNGMHNTHQVIVLLPSCHW